MPSRTQRFQRFLEIIAYGATGAVAVYMAACYYEVVNAITLFFMPFVGSGLLAYYAITNYPRIKATIMKFVKTYPTAKLFTLHVVTHDYWSSAWFACFLTSVLLLFMNIIAGCIGISMAITALKIPGILLRKWAAQREIYKHIEAPHY